MLISTTLSLQYWDETRDEKKREVRNGPVRSEVL